MKPHSKKEIEVMSELEFRNKYYFTKEDISSHFKDIQRIRDFIHGMKVKGRIVRINRNKYFLIPIKAKSGKWTDHPEIIVDEMMNGENYFIGGWFAANNWKITDQIPMQVDVYTTRRQGKVRILINRFVFHRTTKKRIQRDSIIQRKFDRDYRIIKKEIAKKWMKSRN